MSDPFPDPEKPAGALIPFEFEGAAVRSMLRDEQPWFVLADVCKVLEIANHRDAASKLEPDERDAVGLADAIGREQQTTIIAEAGVNRLIFRSDKPQAKRLQKWFFAEVLPALRHTGSYTMPDAQSAKPAANQNLAREARLFLKQAMSVAKIAGLTGNSMLIAANRATRSAVGFDYMAEMGVKYLEAPDNDVLLTATDIGKRLGALSAIRVNHILAEHGFQTGDRDANGHPIWIPTAKGVAAGGQMVEVERSNKTGQARQLRWASRIVDVLRDLIQTRGGDNAAS